MTYAPLRLIGAAVICVVLPGCSGCVQHVTTGPAVEHCAFAAQYLRAGDYELAEQRADLCVEYSGGTYAEAWNLKALIEVHRGHLELAREDAKRALSLRNDFAEAYNTLGTIEQLQHDDDQAVDAYGDAIKLDPGFLAARRNRGLALMRRGEMTQARGDFLKCLEVDPTYCDCRESLGALALEQHDYAEAAGQLEKATQICPSVASVHYNLCVAYLHQSACADAVSACVTALSLESDCLECKHNLTEAYSCVAKSSAVIRRVADAVAKDPTDPSGHFELGASYEEMRLLDEARSEFIAATKLSSGRHLDAVYRLARVDDQLGQAGELVEACQHLLDAARGTELYDERVWCAGRVRQLQLR